MSDETQDEKPWYKVEVLVGEAAAEAATGVLWDLEAAGVEVQDSQTYADDGQMAPVPEGKARLVAYLMRDTEREARELTQALADALGERGIGYDDVHAALYTDTSWRTSWKRYFRPTRLSDRVIVGPPWETFDAPEVGVKLVIEPGMAFGTGTHETTQLCAQVLDEALAAATESGLAPTVLDVGCGSAILSMAAVALGAGRTVGIDVDATAVEVAAENLAANALAGEVELSTTPVDAVAGQFDIVVANILSHILIALRDGLVDRVRPGGLLILSGIDVDKAGEVWGSFADAGWAQIDKRQRGDWIAYALRREEPAQEDL